MSSAMSAPQRRNAASHSRFAGHRAGVRLRGAHAGIGAPYLDRDHSLPAVPRQPRRLDERPAIGYPLDVDNTVLTSGSPARSPTTSATPTSASLPVLTNIPRPAPCEAPNQKFRAERAALADEAIRPAGAVASSCSAVLNVAAIPWRASKYPRQLAPTARCRRRRRRDQLPLELRSVRTRLAEPARAHHRAPHAALDRRRDRRPDRSAGR